MGVVHEGGLDAVRESLGVAARSARTQRMDTEKIAKAIEVKVGGIAEELRASMAE